MLGTPPARTASTSLRGDYNRLIDLVAPDRSTCVQSKAYPSPPMSRPTSPGQHFSKTPATTLSLPATTHHIASPAISTTTTSTYPLATASQHLQPLQSSSTQVASPRYTASAGFATLPVEASSSTRPARKAKAHVASACVNCKRAHLSCDVQRPCRRCVESGKESTCHDVQHKKRGRPRLREDPEAGPSLLTQQQQQQQQPSAVAQSTSTRPIASTRSRRADSYRSHQSRDSESSSFDPNTPQRIAYSAHQPAFFPGPSGFPPTHEVATALLDLDLVILRANRSFQQAVAAIRELTLARLADIVTPIDGVSLAEVRNRLRGEREQREPSFLPPIVQTGQDPLANVHDADVDRLTQGFADSTYTWMPTRSNPGQPPLVARVRLARLTTYFAVVTLPPQWIPAPQYPPQNLHDPYVNRPATARPYNVPLQYSFPPGSHTQPGPFDLRVVVPPTAPNPPVTQMMHAYQPFAISPTQGSISQDSPLVPGFVPIGYNFQQPQHAQHLPPRPAVLQPAMATPGEPQPRQSTLTEVQEPTLGSSAEELAEEAQSRGSKRQRRMGINEVLQ